MRIGREENEHGVMVGVFICDFCGVEFRVTPDPKEDANWKGCLRPECPSYDPDRDFDDRLDELVRLH